MQNIYSDCIRHQYIQNLFRCCGIKLPLAVKLVAVLDITISIVWITLLSLNFSRFWNTPNQTYSKNSSAPQAFWGCYLVKNVAQIFLGILLFDAATSSNIRKCKLWICIITTISLMTSVVRSVDLALYKDDGPMKKLNTVAVATIIIYRIYTVMIVWKFLTNVRLAGRSVCPRNLKDSEVEMFFKGSFRYFPPPRNFREGQRVDYEPYNTSFEISKDCLNIDEENPLEKTDSHLLLKGNMVLSDGSSVLVGVVTTTANVGVSHFRAILSDLKILTYVSSKSHQNLVELLGAITCNIAQRKLWMILEYCSYGCLQRFLIAHRGSYVNLVKNGTISKDYAVQYYCNVQQALKNDLITTFGLLRWSYEICSGLEYLSSIGIVHADLSATNIYLTEEKVAKISVPALELQLYRYSTYDKSEETTLPWRYMAIESIRDVIFNTSSDVWSIGVTIHEIFTLGAIPFSGLSWTPDFVNYLTKGLRMNKPSFATEIIYKKLLECWDNEPTRRPSPKQLCTFFEGILRENHIFNYLTNVTKVDSEDNSSTDSSCIATPHGSI